MNYKCIKVTQTVDNTIVYLKKLIFTDDGTNLWNQKIVINGTDGSINMSGALNITEWALRDGTVVTADIKDDAVTSSKIADETITSADIADGTIKQEDLDPNIEMGVFKKNWTNAYYNSGNVWIWTKIPSATLEVNGDIKANNVSVSNQAYMYVCVKNGAVTNMYIWTETTPPTDTTKYNCSWWTTYKMQALKFNN